ncbi:hypothetical protein NBE98_17425 [Clostridium swellfunianum]|uniref:hypothetical protein n=1 Tax=Clostridium swellfunianum TaxID=1367462 RepID=UPI0020302469|nr:hypothetical protein [Clostridium swellfunianum]MCM0650151.1 hypothetical protein [Clostridium swellfunianum]
MKRSQLVEEYILSGLTLVVWYKEKNISKSSIYAYIKKYYKSGVTSVSEPKWGEITIPKMNELSTILLKIGTIVIHIKNGFDTKTLSEILSVVMNLC